MRMKNKISFQICIIILITNFLTLTLCFAIQNEVVQKILLRNSEKESIKGFEQAEYNIDNFCDQIDLMSRRLAVNTSLRSITRYEKLSEGDKISHVTSLLSDFETEMWNYSYVENISFYSDNGLILSAGQDGNYKLYDQEKENWFYSSELAEESESYGMTVMWKGGYTSRDFGVFETISESKKLNEKEKTNYYMTAFRKTLMGSGVLVINVDMQDFLRVFYSEDASDQEQIYMLDEDGCIIMAADETQLGNKRKFQGIDLELGEYQKGIEENEEGEVQVVLYPLSRMKMFLVSEKPVAAVTSDSRYLRNVLILTCLMSILISCLISRYTISRKLAPLKNLVFGIQNVGKGEFGCELEAGPNNEIGTLTEQFNEMSVELKRMFEEKQKIAEEKSQLEMQALRSQINPHLIYNTMNNIKWMALINNERNIAESITLLSDFLEPIFKNRSNLCTVEDELNYVKNYISIMNLRVAGKYSLEINVPDGYKNCRIIRFLLQPIVENSILHGIGEKPSGMIKISMWSRENVGYIQVQDDGNGILPDKLAEMTEKLEKSEVEEKDGDGVGVLNVNRRIKVQYGKEYGLTLENKECGGAAVTLRIPLNQEEIQEI